MDTRKNAVRRRIYEIIELSPAGDKLSNIYDIAMMITIIASMIPLLFKQTNTAFDIIDGITVSIFIIDYVLRLMTADFKLQRGWHSFFRYPFTFMAIIDLLSILPSFSMFSSGFKTLKVLRLFRTFKAVRAFKVVKAFKLFRYSRSLQVIVNVIKEETTALLAVGTLAVGYVLFSALIIFNVEPDTFSNFFEAIYWATVSLTTMGYGDIYPVTTAGRIITMLSSMVGIAIVALPAGIITAGYLSKLNSKNEK